MGFRLSVVLFFLLSGIASISQTDTGKETYTKMLKVQNNIYVLQSDGGNIGLSFGKDGIFMVDDFFSGNVEQMQKEIKKISDKPVRFVVNTHFHNDHSGGNPILAKEGATIFSHELVRERLMKVMNEGAKKLSEDLLPMVTFEEKINFYFNNEKIVVFHVPNAHTDGDVMVYFTQSNVLQTGDVFVNGQYPFIDLKNGGSVKGYEAGIQKALALINQQTKIIPGHGPISTYKELENNLRLLSVTYKKVTQQVLLGKTEDEVANMKELTDTYNESGYKPGYVTADDFIRTLYKDASSGSSEKKERLKENEDARKKYEQIKRQQESKKKKKN
ncbi:MBL fold metallo-hydrolase [Aequorivita sp. H23M31]|uniref:MBL fold metallo-hydrolase n=1 Tax=Aequorivita ciconiae TaxID=2494375 RepID=A0A410G3T9_9FLAO|nr:MBL fold metallo-hydrolase [Aequorivita sp. H23M31]QAA81940.1 MBL fold metallo-hydrolase [Aequorivita sp. H23M31]